MSVPHAKVIVNLLSDAGSARRKWPRISRLLKNAGLSFDYECTERAGHAIELARTAADSGYRYIIAVGGDGTVNEVANGILSSNRPNETSLGVIGTGTGNDFARSVGIPGNYTKACSFLISPRRRKIDVGVVEFTRTGQTLRSYFVAMAGIGFDAEVVEATGNLPKYFGGAVPYLGGFLKSMLSYQNRLVTLKSGDRTEVQRILNVMVANGSYIGKGMLIAPKAELNDGLLDVVIIGDMSKYELLEILPKVYKGTHIKHPKVRMEQTSHITIESSERVLMYADGELLGECPVSFSVVPSALSIVA